MKGFKIGNVNIDVPIALGPMAGVTDLPFRILCREQGCGLTFTEMISAKGIYYKSPNTEELMALSEKDRPSGLQLFGSDPGIMAEMAHLIEDRPFDILDINMGCPVPKVVNNGEGSALMKDPELVYRIVKEISMAISKPVTVKIRKGFDLNSVNAVEVAEAAAEGGAKCITVHGRTRTEMYRGTADLSIIREVKEHVDIPVIGSGDVVSGETALRMFKETGCDGIMIARAARGNPWIFGEVMEYLKEGHRRERPSAEELKEMIIRHAEGLSELKGEYKAVREMRTHIAFYVSGMYNATRIKQGVNFVNNMEDLKALVSTIGEDTEQNQ